MFKNLRWFPGFLKRYFIKLKYTSSLRRHKTIGILNYFSYLLILMIRVILPGLPRSLWTEIPGKAWLTPSYDPPIRSPRPCGKENYRESYTPHKVKTYWTFFLFKEKNPQCSRQLSGAKCLHENDAKFPRKQLVVIIFRLRCISYFLGSF